MQGNFTQGAKKAWRQTRLPACRQPCCIQCPRAVSTKGRGAGHHHSSCTSSGPSCWMGHTGNAWGRSDHVCLVFSSFQNESADRQKQSRGLPWTEGHWWTSTQLHPPSPRFWNDSFCSKNQTLAVGLYQALKSIAQLEGKGGGGGEKEKKQQ